MAYLALYRKYRPNKFEEVAGQNYVVKVLQNSIANDKLSHAYLFSGPRGTGKTTIAKLIAKLINCENRKDLVPCEQCSSCLAFNKKNHPDIIEIDAASNNGVDEIREIRDNVSLMPVLSNYKIYIIDEVHMLSSGAFNALLKTLEEPPKHVIFILATTEFYKVPETIVSRCQCFEFERIPDVDIVNKLKEIASAEKMNVEDDVFSLIAKYSNGGLRDAISMLDKLYCCSDTISVKDFYELKGIISDKEYKIFVDYLLSSDINNLLAKIDDLFNRGKNIILIADGLLEFVKNIIIDKVQSDDFNDTYKYFNLLNDLDRIIYNMKNSVNPKILFEVGLLEFIDKNENISREIIRDKKCDNKTKKEINDKPSNAEMMSEEVTIVSKEIPELAKSTIDGDKKESEIIIDSNEDSEKLKFIKDRNKTRINNALATADKSSLNKIKDNWQELNNYLHNNDFYSIVSYLLDGDLKVVGTDNAIVSLKYDSILVGAYENIGQIELLFGLAFNKMYKLAFVLDEEWDKIRVKYVEDRKNGIIYSCIEEKDFNDIIKESKEKVNVDDESKTAIDLFGNDLVEIKK